SPPHPQFRRDLRPATHSAHHAARNPWTERWRKYWTEAGQAANHDISDNVDSCDRIGFSLTETEHTYKMKTISLFTGAGGLDVGLEQAGFEVRLAVEIDRWAQETLELNRAAFRDPGFQILGDITGYEPEEILSTAGLAAGEATLVAGGPPCQSFSTAGRRGSIGDPRGSLFANFAAVVRVAKPRFFVMENVRGILSAPIKHRPLTERGENFPPLEPEEQQGSAFRVILDELEGLGYQLTYGLVDAADYGVPQNRLRVIVLGSRDKEFKSRDINAVVPPTHTGHWLSLRDALQNLNGGPPEFVPYSAERERILALVPPGHNWRWFRDHPKYGQDFAAQLMGGAWGADGGRVGFFRRLTWDKPSPTLPT
ncbi:MAG TPA: DNA cytosine methyltransferase, partial [Rubrobacter sp.]|nr:DNA cytosine methyltransferase [Rubrobacter sp.]